MTVSLELTCDILCACMRSQRMCGVRKYCVHVRVLSALRLMLCVLAMFAAWDGAECVQDEYVYNPLKLPTGVDGKPIPYWLYKLHGLNQEYKCDICGGDVFKGRREYERHFRDSKHVNAMHALGIPSSKAFFEVTKVEEALALWQNLKNRSSGNWNADTQEEFEDDEGNVYNKKTYLDLQRQGLV